MNMKLSSLTLATAGLLFFSQPTANALSVVAPELTPGGSLIGVVSLNNPGDLAPLFRDSRASKVFQQLTEIQFADDPEFQEATEEVNEFLNSLGEGVTLSSLMGEVITGIDLYVGTKVVGEDRAPVLTILECSSAEQAQKIFDQLEIAEKKNYAKTGATDPTIKKDIAGNSVSYNPIDNSYVLVKGNALIFSKDEAILASSLKAEGGETIAKLENLSFLESKMIQKGDLVVYANMSELTKNSIDPALQDKANGQLLMNVDVDGNAIKSEYFFKPTTITASKKAFLSIAPAANESTASFLPSNGLASYSTNLLEPSVINSAYDELKQNPDTSGQFMMLESMAQQAGLNLKDDLLAAFGPMISISLGKPDPSMPLPIPSITIAAKIANQEKANIVITKIEEGLIYQATESVRQMNPDAPDATVTTTDFNGTPIRSVSFSTPFVKVPAAHSLTNDGYYLLSIGSGGIQSALTAHAQNNGVASSEQWKSLRPNEFGTVNHFAAVDMAGISAFIRQIVPLASGFTGATPEDVANTNVALDFLESLGTMYNANRNDEAGTHGFTVLKIQ